MKVGDVPAATEPEPIELSVGVEPDVTMRFCETVPSPWFAT